MEKTHDYKKLEDSLIRRVKNAGKIINRGLFRSLQAAGRFLTRRYTVVFVPYNEKRVYNIRITVLSIFCFFLITIGVFGTFFWISASFSTTQGLLSEQENKIIELQASLDQLRDEAAAVLGAARIFEDAFSGTLGSLGVDFKTQNKQSPGGDFSSIFNIRETPDNLLQEVSDMRRLTALLLSAAVPIKDIGAIVNSQSALLTEIPSIWPVKDGLGQITMFFGQNINPFSGQYYIHKGIDIATFRAGDPVVATADGQVVTIEYAEDYGNYVIIQHKHGYYTRYAHLLSARPRLGQWVQQGEVVGYIGSTGLSTGPHLHYEIHIGSDVVDPYKYINIRSSAAKQGR